ncbi:MAG TPA: DUF302 domain-containing protein [Aurantimonas sp.]|uniref:DUF302 domain-containing protein n=1 Tax=Aurantimonas marianensis TaxID=2920428 RepID=A0A9X2H9P6_9HYPH|nr:DUF302 domain-containing protein [Aurantimonas marianensis]MCP3056060.1 DUF302 domain-containing protein [Aurantimonas marianensis]
MKRTAIKGGAIALLFAGLAAMPATAAETITSYETDAPFDEVRQDLTDAIVNRGYVIDYEAFVGEMLARTGGDVGAEKTLFQDGNANVMQFCSAVLSRKAMEADIMNLSFCPYGVFVYENAETAGTVTVGFRRLDEIGSDESKAAIGEINAVLDEIAKEAAGAE